MNNKDKMILRALRISMQPNAAYGSMMTLYDDFWY